MTEKEEKKHISFSELKDYYFCPKYHNIKWIEKLISFFGNEYTLTGTAVHSTCEKLLSEEYDKRKNNEVYEYNDEEIVKYFTSKFKEEMISFKENNEEAYKKLNRINTMKIFEQCKGLFNNILSFMKEKYGNYEVFKVEHELYQPIEGFDYNFKGFIDLVIKTESGKYVVIDWKSASWGWDIQKKTSKETTYQLTYYKHYFAKEFNIDPKNIDTCFILLKRTAKQDKNIELVPVTVGARKIENALEYLGTAVKNIMNKNIERNFKNCSQCECYPKFCNGRSDII